MHEPAPAAWRRVGAWDGILAACRHGRSDGVPGVVATPLEGFGVAGIIGRHGHHHGVAVAFAIDLPAGPAVTRNADLDVIWSGPDQWLAVSQDRLIAAQLERALAPMAAVVDQSDARALLRLCGPRLRQALAKGCPIDLDPRVFRAGDAATTVTALIGITLWCPPGEDEALHVSVPRSMAGSFWSWFAESAAEFGLEVRAPMPVHRSPANLDALR